MLRFSFAVGLATVSLLAQDAVTVRVDANARLGPLKPVFSFFGYDEPNYTYMKDGKKLLSELAALSPVTVHVRAHNLLTSGDGEAALKWGSTNAYTEDANGKPVYDWTIADRIFDTYLERKMKPLVEIGFMPQALSVKPDPYRHNWDPAKPYGNIYTGWAHPPKDYNKWAELVYQWVKHCEQKYGRAEVASWYWEVWNEPDIGYWQSTPEEYFKLYDYAADAVKRALPAIRIGGPTTTGPDNPKAAKFLRDFLEHSLRGKNFATGKNGSPLDYISFHAKGRPRVVEGHVQMGIDKQLRDIGAGFEIVASFPELKSRPIIIGESDPEGCAACSVKYNPQNAYRNGTMYSSYTAASFARKWDLAAKYGVNFEGAVSWAFEFEGQPYFDGFRDLATNGIDKPVLNVFRMYGLMGRDRIQAESSAAVPVETMKKESVRGKADIGALASRTDRAISVMVWNSVWKSMGSPQQPTPEQYARLEAAGQLQLVGSPTYAAVEKGGVRLPFSLPRQGVSLVQLSW